MSDQTVASSPDQSANSGAFVKAFLPGLIIGLVLGGLAGAFFGGFAADSGGPAAAIERSKAEAIRMGTQPVPPAPMPAAGTTESAPAEPKSDEKSAAPSPAKPEEKPK